MVTVMFLLSFRRWFGIRVMFIMVQYTSQLVICRRLRLAPAEPFQDLPAQRLRRHAATLRQPLCAHWNLDFHGIILPKPGKSCNMAAVIGV